MLFLCPHNYTYFSDEKTKTQLGQSTGPHPKPAAGLLTTSGLTRSVHFRAFSPERRTSFQDPMGQQVQMLSQVHMVCLLPQELQELWLGLWNQDARHGTPGEPVTADALRLGTQTHEAPAIRLEVPILGIILYDWFHFPRDSLRWSLFPFPSLKLPLCRCHSRWATGPCWFCVHYAGLSSSQSLCFMVAEWGRHLHGHHHGTHAAPISAWARISHKGLQTHSFDPRVML